MDKALRREMGAKLKNFREKLAIAINAEKINQELFGRMFGGYSRRKITSYERGSATMPADLIYLLFKAGNSIDGIFREDDLTKQGRDTARQLYQDATNEITGDDVVRLADDNLRKKATRKAATRNVASGDPEVKKGNPRDPQQSAYKGRQK